MGLLRNRLTRRFSTLGLVSDVALVATALTRAVRSNGNRGRPSPVELAFAGGAALRLLQRLRRRRRARRLTHSP